MKGEKIEDYQRLIRCVKELYIELNIPLPVVWLSDGDPGIPAAIASEISPHAVHLLCSWHIEKNVLQNCRKFFGGREDGNELWSQFFGNKNTMPRIVGDFQRLMYTDSPHKFETLWQELRGKYSAINDNIISYLAKEIIPKKKKWSRAWTDSYLHFDNHTSSRSEGGHATLKASLGNSKSDLDTVVRTSRMTCDRQRSDYLLELGKARTRFPSTLKRGIFRDIQALVTPYALKKIAAQHDLVVEAQEKGKSLQHYTGRLTATLGLPCCCNRYMISGYI